MAETVHVKKYRTGAQLPLQGTAHAAGYDITACIEEKVVIRPGERSLIPTGLLLELPSGMEAQVRPRSGLAIRNGVTLLNSPGTIDADYRGEVKVILINHSQEPFTVDNGMRIGQLVFKHVCSPQIVEVDAISETARGSGGFGHTGL